jgi:ankyrin repeat protein
LRKVIWSNETLVERGAAINNTNKYGATPLILVYLNGNLDSVIYLTEMGAVI